MQAAQSTESSNQQELPLREWTYLVKLVGKSWAGTYGASPFTGKAGTAGDGSHIKSGAGEEGRITGGVATGYTEAEIRSQLDGLYILKEKRKDEQGKEQEIVTQTYRLISLEPRTVLFTQ